MLPFYTQFVGNSQSTNNENLLYTSLSVIEGAALYSKQEQRIHNITTYPNSHNKVAEVFAHVDHSLSVIPLVGQTGPEPGCSLWSHRHDRDRLSIQEKVPQQYTTTSDGESIGISVQRLVKDNNK